mgnify:FL=1
MIEWVPVATPLAGLVGLLIWLVRAITSGKLVSGPHAQQLLAAQQKTIDKQAKQIETLLAATQLASRVVQALPVAPESEEVGS